MPTPEEALAAALAKMSDAGVGPSARAIFAANFEALAAGSTGMIREADVEPVGAAAETMGTSTPGPADPADLEALSRTVLIRLNGGLGTSMGMDRAKSLLPVRDGLTFLDIIVRQVLAARSAYDVPLPLLFMHSFATRADCLEALARYPELPVGDLPVDMVQSQEPRLLQSDLSPVEWPDNPALEWCPPGHGDLYPTLLDSGILDQLIEAGFPVDRDPPGRKLPGRVIRHREGDRQRRAFRRFTQQPVQLPEHVVVGGAPGADEARLDEAVPVDDLVEAIAQEEGAHVVEVGFSAIDEA